MLFCRQYLAASTMPSTPRCPNPPGTSTPSACLSRSQAPWQHNRYISTCVGRFAAYRDSYEARYIGSQTDTKYERSWEWIIIRRMYGLTALLLGRCLLLPEQQDQHVGSWCARPASLLRSGCAALFGTTCMQAPGSAQFQPADMAAMASLHGPNVQPPAASSNKGT